MYLHLGQETVVNLKDVIGIFDLDNTTISKHTRSCLSKAQKERRVFDVSMELPKSFIVCREQNQDIIYLSPISAATLLKRQLSDY